MFSSGGAGEEEILELLTYLLEVASSDGAFIGADDSAEVVIAALHNYGFLTTQVDDLEHESERRHRSVSRAARLE